MRQIGVLRFLVRKGNKMDAAIDKIMEARNYDGVAVKDAQAVQQATMPKSAEHEKARAGLFPALAGASK